MCEGGYLEGSLFYPSNEQKTCLAKETAAEYVSPLTPPAGGAGAGRFSGEAWALILGTIFPPRCGRYVLLSAAADVAHG
jgi:hypothetical protein